MSQHDPLDDALYQDPDLAQFYDLANAWGPDLDTCRHLAWDAGSVLDLGCGTGQLAAGLATSFVDGRTVFGVDPAAAMLDIARRRPGGDKVAWVHADAQSVRLGRRFDLVLLTGHAFQVFLTGEDQKAVFSTIAAHLAPEGRFIFDARNPAAEAWREWVPELSQHRIEHPSLGAVKSWNDVAHDGTTGIVTYQTHYRVVESGRSFSASSKILFTPQETLAAMLDEAGLKVDRWLGGWTGEPYTATSPEIIPLGRLR
jgi:SAM-dependent methyltransferase